MMSQAPSPPAPPMPPTVQIQLTLDGSTPTSTSSAMMASFNLDWHASTEESPFWVNMSAQVINLDSPILLAAARAMAPSVLRIGGSEGDVLCYDASDQTVNSPSHPTSICFGVTRGHCWGAPPPFKGGLAHPVRRTLNLVASYFLHADVHAFQ